jgi:putative transposase
MLRQGDEGTSLDEIFRKAEIDLPQQFRTIDYVRDRSRFGGSDPQSTFHGRTYGGDHPRGGSRSVSEVAKRHGISEPMSKRFGGFGASDVRRPKQLEAENARLKKLVAERDLEIEVMKEVAAKNW